MSESSIRNILVGLDLSSTDQAILSFLSQNHEMLSAEKFHFIHVEEKLTDEKESDTGSIGMKREEIENLLSRRIKNALPDDKIDYELHLLEGNPGEEIRQSCQAKEADLLVLGHKLTKKHEVEPNKLVLKAACSLLLVPEKDHFEIKKIGVAVDFSDLSLQALKEAKNIASSTSAELIGIHTYQVPSGYHKSGKNHWEFAKVMEGHAKKDAQKFLNKASIQDVDIAYIYDENKKPAEAIEKFCTKNNIGLLVMGSKGRTGAASVLIGSVAKKLAKKLYDIPVVILKDKKESMDFLEALKKV